MKATSKREIAPHKGGRTERVYARVTPDEKRALYALLERLGLSLADYLVQCVRRDNERKSKGE